MTSIRILILEDDPLTLSLLQAAYALAFTARGYEPEIEVVTTIEEAKKCAKEARLNPYDFVSLDVNLGHRTLTGLDVLLSFKRFGSAWMAALLTGVETDPSLDQTMGKERGARLRAQLRRDAYASFAPERLLVIEKPSTALPNDEARKLLSNRVQQIALVYEEVGRLRYVFRPIEVESLVRIPTPKGTQAKRRLMTTRALHWQIRFDCGELRTLPDKAGFKTLHYLLSRAPQDPEVTPEEALAVEPKSEREVKTDTQDPVADYFESQGVTWKNMSASEQEKLMRAALSLRFKRFCELRSIQEDGDSTTAEEEELDAIMSELGPLQNAAETAYQRIRPKEREVYSEDQINAAQVAQNDLHIEGGNYVQTERGFDSPAARAFRTRMKRVKDCLRENGFSDFSDHLDAHIKSSGAKWSYDPKRGIEWTTT